MFNTDFTSENQKLDHINKIVEMANSISDNILMVDSLYKRNPYTSSNILVNKIKNAFSPKTDLEFEKHAEFFFNEFKTALAYNYAKVQFLDPKLKDIKRSFQAFGFKDESIDYLIHTVHHGDYKTVKRYVDYKQTQLDALKKEKSYLETMLNNFPATTPLEGASKQDFKVQLKNVEDNIERLEKLIKEVDDTAKNLPKRKEDEDDEIKNKRQELLNRIIFEEVSPEQAERYKKNKDELEKVKDKLKHAANTEEEIENLKKEQEDPTSTQEGIVDAAEESIKETTPDLEEAPNPPVDPASWMKAFFLTDQIKIKGVVFNIVDKLKTTKPNGEPALVLENEGKKYGLVKRGDKFYIIRTEGLDRIGINKKETEVDIEILHKEDIIVESNTTILEEENATNNENFSLKERQVLENENFRLSEETYSLEDIKKYSDRYFVKADQDISLLKFSLYFWKDSLLITKIKKGNIETVRSGKAKVNKVTKTPITEFREIVFKDKLSIKDQQEQEQEKQEPKKTEIDNAIKEFLGSSFTEDKAKSIKTAIEKGLIEIEC